MEEKETQNNTQNTNSQKEPNKRRFKPRNQQDRTREEKQWQEGQSRNHYRHKKSQNNSGQNGEKFHNRNGGNREVNQSNLELRKAVEVNAKVHQNSLTTHSQVQFNPNGKVRITPIGGLGEIGGNMTVIETQNSAIIIDAGMSFPDGDMHGIDILVPDFSYLEVIKDKIAGIVITHAHEDQDRKSVV